MELLVSDPYPVTVVDPVDPLSPSPQPAPSASGSAGDFRWLKKKLNLDGKLSRNTELAIETELLDHFQRHAPAPVLMVNLILAASLVAVMWRWAVHSQLLTWLVLQTSIVVANGVLYRFFQGRANHSRQRSNQYWYRWFCAGVTLNGLSWGLATAWFYTPAAHLQSIFMILIVAGISAGVTTVQTSLRAGFMLFIVPALLTLAFSAPLRFGLDEITVTALLSLYCCAISYTGFNNHKTVVETIRLKFEKDHLLAQVHGSEAYFRALIENATDLVLVVDVKGTIVFQSPSSRHVVGYRPEELVGLCLFDFVHSEDVHGMRSTLQYLCKYPGVSTGGEARWRHRNGHWLIMEGNGRSMDIDPSLVVVNARDVTERRAMETELRDAKIRAESANQAKSLFLANMSHEIRTPMHAILAMADVLRETELSNSQQRYVGAFKDAGEYLLSLLNDLLEFSRIESGELKLANAPFHLPQLIERVFDLMWVQAKNKNLTLNYLIEPSVRPWHLGDPQRLRQIIVNLVNNAIKFTEEGEIMIRVANGGPDRIVLEVIDTGEGIENDKKEIIFESFRQASAVVGDRYGGAGLGLAICKRLVEAMDGQISVQSEKNVGSTFRCNLKLSATDEPSEWLDQRERHAAVTAAKLPPSHILVADDSAMNRMVIEEFLRFTACTLDFVANGLEALEKLRVNRYDLVLMDLRMPVMDGVTATRQLRRWEQDEKLASIPVVALTAGVSLEDRESALQAGCNDYLAKPVSKEELTLVLVKHLQRQRQFLKEEFA